MAGRRLGVLVGSGLGVVLVATAMAVAAQDSFGSFGMGNCFPPPDPYPYKLDKSDPLYEAAREEHQAHLEGLEDYVNCLDRERSVALAELRSSFDLFMANFGRDAVLSYGAERESRP